VRDFWVWEGRERDFERVFGTDGIWPDFLKRSRQYLGSEFWLESRVEHRFRLVDYWTSHVGFEALRAIHQLDLGRIEQFVRNDGLIRREEFLGAFYIDDSGLGEGDELVPS
jgi:hypothetical protein